MNVAMQTQNKLILLCISLVVLASCSDEPQRNPGRVYMPDMAYSVAYETYSVTPEKREALLKKGIHYSNIPVRGNDETRGSPAFRYSNGCYGRYNKLRGFESSKKSPGQSRF